jgi:hypothetical protein
MLSLADPTLSLSAKSGLHLTLTDKPFFTFTDPLPDLAYLAGNPFFALSDCDFTSSLLTSYPI